MIIWSHILHTKIVVSLVYYVEMILVIKYMHVTKEILIVAVSRLLFGTHNKFIFKESTSLDHVVDVNAAVARMICNV